jgi:leucyl-tRNA synthetase
VGAARFLDRLWRLAEECEGAGVPGTAIDVAALSDAEQAVYRRLHQTIRKVSTDYEAMQFNTGLAALMELLNDLTTVAQPGSAFKGAVLATMAQLLAPLAPHFAEEVWQRLGGGQSIFRSRWPEADPRALVEATVTLAVQVNGKLRAQVSIPAALDEREAVAAALADPKVARFVGGAPVIKTIFVPGRLVNIVVRGTPQG